MRVGEFFLAMADTVRGNDWALAILATAVGTVLGGGLSNFAQRRYSEREVKRIKRSSLAVLCGEMEVLRRSLVDVGVGRLRFESFEVLAKSNVFGELAGEIVECILEIRGWVARINQIEEGILRYRIEESGQAVLTTRRLSEEGDRERVALKKALGDLAVKLIEHEKGLSQGARRRLREWVDED